MTQLAPELMPVTEKEVAQQVAARFCLAGWYDLRTEANNKSRHTDRAGKSLPGDIPPGFPDRVFFRGLGNGLGICALVELKRPKGGRVSVRQAQMHANLLQNYRQQVHIVRSLEDAQAVIALGQTFEAALKKAGLI